MSTGRGYRRCRDSTSSAACSEDLFDVFPPATQAFYFIILYLWKQIIIAMEISEQNTLRPLDNNSNSHVVPIENLIHVIRGQQVILDSDLAHLYGVETKRLKEQVKRNIDRFPPDFMFQLTKTEAETSRSQFATLNEKDVSLNANSCSKLQNETLNVKRGKNIKYLPFAFTENGVAMLSSVLRSKIAIEVNIRIMRAFTSMRSFMKDNANMFKRLETIEYHQLLMQQHITDTELRI